jgi:hypothetical protein
MKSLRSVMAQSPAIVISVLALILSAGGGAAYAATRAPAAITWHNLALLHGWKSSQGQYGTGNPSYSISNGVVYLSGSLHHPSGSNEQFATLPKGARPTHDLYITVYTLDDSSGTLYIGANGVIDAYSPVAADATGFTSLAGVSFPTSS